jgi:hypothetical protein
MLTVLRCRRPVAKITENKLYPVQIGLQRGKRPASECRKHHDHRRGTTDQSSRASLCLFLMRRNPRNVLWWDKTQETVKGFRPQQRLKRP